MKKTCIKTSFAPEVIIEQASGNLYLKGWDRSEVTITAAPDTLNLQEEDDTLRISCQSDCTIRVPNEASVVVESAKGAVRAKFLEDQLTVGEVFGQLDLRDIAEVSVKEVHGNLRARRISGNLMVEEIAGNARVRDIQGNCSVGVINGNADLRQVEGEINISVEGNVRLRLSMLIGNDYQIKANGNIHCRIPSDANVELNMYSDAELIRVRMPETSQTIKETSYTLTLGSGDIRMNLTAGGNIYLSALETWDEEEVREDFTPLPEDFGDRIAAQVEAQIEEQMEMMNRRLEEQFETLSATIGASGLSEDEMERIMEQARIKSERASMQAEKKMRRAQEKMVRKMEAARRREALKAQAAARKGRRKAAWTGKKPPTPSPEPVSDEERLMILRMLEEKKITPEEADKLFEALEGEQD